MDLCLLSQNKSNAPENNEAVKNPQKENIVENHGPEAAGHGGETGLEEAPEENPMGSGSTSVKTSWWEKVFKNFRSCSGV